MRISTTYTYIHSIEGDVSADAVWALYADVETWPSWDSGAERVTRDGPFSTGTTGTMKLRGQDPMTYRLTKVEPLREFVDETAVGDIVVRVSHVLEPLSTGRLRLTCAVEIDGPEEHTQQLGPAITGDFPDVMAALIARASQRSH